MKGLTRAVRKSSDEELVRALMNCRYELNRIFELEDTENPIIDDLGEIEMAVMVEMSERFCKMHRSAVR